MTDRIPVPFLTQAPDIDGLLCEITKALPAHPFAHTIKMDPANPDFEVSYRLAYGTSFLYLFVEVAAKTWTCRDRGFQNGDGLVVALAAPQPAGAPSNRFYYLAFWPQSDPVEPVAKMIWGHDGDFPFHPLDTARFAVEAKDGTVGFELLLPWEAVPPYHPWLCDGIGLDVYFTKAVGDTQANVYTVALEDFGSASQGYTVYAPLIFAPAALEEDASQTYAQTARHAVGSSTPLSATAVTLAAVPGQEHLVLDLHTGEGTRVARTEVTYDVEPGLTRRPIALPLTDLTPGGYQVRWRSRVDGSQGSAGITLLPSFQPAALRVRLERTDANLAPGSVATLLFLLASLEGKLTSLDPYKCYAELRIEIARFLDLLQQAEAGHDALACRTGLFRRAFRSQIDNSLQPYSVCIPADYDPAHSYPAVVHLHGSDRDDTALSYHYRYAAPQGFIQIAPFGRGTLSAYTKDHAQEDIQEAIADACRNYSIDRTRMVLTGFSMGGYGVYRTLYEAPGTFRGAAVFSGIPDLADRYFPGEGHPNFLDTSALARLRATPLFVFHGSEDRNAPVELTKQTVSMLMDMDAPIEFCLEDGTGHSVPNDNSVQCYHTWVKLLLGLS